MVGQAPSPAVRRHLAETKAGAVVQAGAVHGWAGWARPSWLVYVNAADPPAWMACAHPAGGGQVLITSRNPVWRGIAPTISVDVLPREEAVAFLHRRTRSGSNAGLEQLAEVLGDLPLALEQAAAYLEETDSTPAAYLALLRERTSELLALGTPRATPPPWPPPGPWPLRASKKKRRSPRTYPEVRSFR